MTIYKTSLQKWNIFSRSVFPLSNPMKLSSMSISQLDSYATSVCEMANIIQIDLNISKFNRLTGEFNFNIKSVQTYKWNSWCETQYEDFIMIVSFLQYLYKIDCKNKFVKDFVINGSERNFARLWHFITAEKVYLTFKKIKKTHELIYEFFKKIKLGPDYNLSVSFYEKEDKSK